MLTEYDEWSAEIEHHNERNSSLLSLVQFSLMCGIFSLVVGTAFQSSDWRSEYRRL